ncbi:MAG: hypothetical protein DPW18_14815 [Chloroflexi bacterium]|nr:hypothetical protein [Chloroflexota bacterium]MDL1942301.1 hypothetical protein [Chloroflexi bacterium CFX2]
MSKKLPLLILLAILLSSCLPSQQPTADVQSQVNTAVAGTMQANEQIARSVEETVSAQQPEAAPPSEQPGTSSIVFQVSETPTFTATPFTVASATPTNTPIPLKYTCTVISRAPRDNTTFRQNEEFEIKWTVVNTGTRPWYENVDIKFVGGTNFAGSKRVEIRKGLQPGESFEVRLDGKAPSKAGYYVMTWLVDGPMCYAYAAINVK